MVLTGVAFVHKVRAEQSGPETQHLSLLLSVFVSVCHTYDCLFGHIHSFIPLQQLVFRGRLQERGREDELQGHCNELLLQWSTSPHHQTTHQGGRGCPMQLTVFHVMIVVVHTLAAHVSYSKPFSDCVFSLINATSYVVVSITCLSCRSPHAGHSPVLAALRGCGLTPPTLQSVGHTPSCTPSGGPTLCSSKHGFRGQRKVLPPCVAPPMPHPLLPLIQHLAYF